MAQSPLSPLSPLSRLSVTWSKVLNSITHMMQKIATVLADRTHTWLEKQINHSRRWIAQRREYRKITRQFNTTLKTCYKHNKISKKEMKMAKKQWKEAMKKVKKEDKRRGKNVSVSELYQ